MGMILALIYWFLHERDSYLTDWEEGDINEI
jgi:hypothetical protein